MNDKLHIPTSYEKGVKAKVESNPTLLYVARNIVCSINFFSKLFLTNVDKKINQHKPKFDLYMDTELSEQDAQTISTLFKNYGWTIVFEDLNGKTVLPKIPCGQTPKKEGKYYYMITIIPFTPLDFIMNLID